MPVVVVVAFDFVRGLRVPYLEVVARAANGRPDRARDLVGRPVVARVCDETRLMMPPSHAGGRRRRRRAAHRARVRVRRPGASLSQLTGKPSVARARGFMGCRLDATVPIVAQGPWRGIGADAAVESPHGRNRDSRGRLIRASRARCASTNGSSPRSSGSVIRRTPRSRLRSTAHLAAHASGEAIERFVTQVPRESTAVLRVFDDHQEEAHTSSYAAPRLLYFNRPVPRPVQAGPRAGRAPRTSGS